MKLQVLAVFALAFATMNVTAAPAGEARSNDPEAAAATAADKVKCVRHRETGSNRSKKVCMSTSRWNQLTAEERDAVIRSDKGASVLDD